MKTKEQVLSISSLTPEQKERANAYFVAMERFKKPQEMPCKTNDEVIKFINNLQNNYNNRKKAEIRKKAAKEAIEKDRKELLQLVSEAKKYGYTLEDVKNIVMDAIKAKKNEAILAKIEELKSQLI